MYTTFVYTFELRVDGKKHNNKRKKFSLSPDSASIPNHHVCIEKYCMLYDPVRKGEKRKNHIIQTRSLRRKTGKKNHLRCEEKCNEEISRFFPSSFSFLQFRLVHQGGGKCKFRHKFSIVMAFWFEHQFSSEIHQKGFQRFLWNTCQLMQTYAVSNLRKLLKLSSIRALKSFYSSFKHSFKYSFKSSLCFLPNEEYFLSS